MLKNILYFGYVVLLVSMNLDAAKPRPPAKTTTSPVVPTLVVPKLIAPAPAKPTLLLAPVATPAPAPAIVPAATKVIAPPPALVLKPVAPPTPTPAPATPTVIAPTPVVAPAPATLTVAPTTAPAPALELKLVTQPTPTPAPATPTVIAPTPVVAPAPATITVAPTTTPAPTSTPSPKTLQDPVISNGVPVALNLAVQNQYTVQQLLTLINKGDPNGTKSFLMPTQQGQLLLSTQCWPASGANLDGSASAVIAGLQGSPVGSLTTGVIDSNLNTMVTLQQDPVLINYLTRLGSLDASTQQAYSRILLYFDLGGYRFYLADPYPGKPFKRLNRVYNPAQQTISSWRIQ